MPLQLDDSFLERFRLAERVYVTAPDLPSLDEYTEALRPVWSSGWLTNNGRAHRELEDALSRYFDREQVSLICNGTLALTLALHAFDLRDGEVITTPFTFPATPHAVRWSGMTPVFADIEPRTFCLDPEAVARAVTPNTRAIMPVHVYGYPCDVDAFDALGRELGVPVIYDAAHAMGVRYRGRPLVAAGDASTLSFHATKLFTTGEGGALVTRSPAMKEKVYFLKNFGIAGETSVLYPGINAKMNELQATLGLLTLERVADEIERRVHVDAAYRGGLEGVAGLTLPPVVPEHESNYSYFPVRVDADAFGATADEVNQALRRLNVVARRYFHPLCSRFECYADLPSSNPGNLPVAEVAAREILCLPMYGTLAPETVAAICTAMRELRGLGV